jgi:signal transduction histidine kinase
MRCHIRGGVEKGCAGFVESASDVEGTMRHEGPAFLSGGGGMGRRARAHDWSATPLGAPDAWPQSLRTAFCLMLHARQPMFVAWEPELSFLYNDAYALVLGAKHPAALGRPFAAVWSDIWPQFGPIVERVMAGEALAYDDLPIPMTRNGYHEDTWFSFSYTPLHDESGRIAGLFCACNETTDKVRGEEALRAQEAQLALERSRLDALFRHLPVGVNFTDAAGRSLLSNPAFHAYIPDGIIPSTTEDEAARWIAFDEDGHRLSRDRFPAARALRGEEGALVDFLHCPQAGPARWTRVSAVPLRDSARQVTGALATVVDIDAERRAQEALRRLNETLEQRVENALAERNLWAEIFSTTDAFIMVLDLDYRLLAINRASSAEFEEIYGVCLKVGDSVLERLADQPEQREAIQALWAPALAGHECTVIREFGSPDRTMRHYEVKLSTLRNRKGEQIGAYHYALDVTERVASEARLAEAEEQLRQAQKMEAVGQLTGGIAHDFNNLLTGITGSLQLLETRLAQARLADVTRYIVAAQGAAKRAAALTHRLLAFSRRQTLSPKATDVNRLVAGMEELIRRTVGPAIEVEVVGTSGLWTTLVDPYQLENALLNLCINARDAMPDGGRLTIETANKWMDERAARGQELPPGQYLSLCVTDTGTGMTPEVAKRAFDLFFTTKPLGMGTGLGLSMVYGFARQSGGQVRIYSEIGQGTTLCLYLPRHHAAADPLGAVDEPMEAPRSGQGETVLVVDDEPTVRMLVTEVLEELGYAAIEAAEGAAALKVLQSNVRLDLLVTDVGLPGGMNGRQVADAARTARPGLKVLFITGYAENAAVGNGQLEPGMEVLTKPFSVEALAARIRGILEQA